MATKYCRIIPFIFMYVCIMLPYYNVHCNRVLKKMYEGIQGDMACFKRFNGTHEIGCSSNFWGNVGVVHLILDESDLNWFLHNGSHPPYVLALVPEYFTKEVLMSASKSNKLSGVVLLNSENFTIPSHFSGDQLCPNSQSSFYENTSMSQYCEAHPWNPFGSSLLLTNWNFPIFLIDEEKSINNIISCYTKFNKPEENGEPKDWPLCAIELQSNMFATTNSEVCMRRSQTLFSSPDRNFCDPLEDVNVWSTIRPLNISVEPAENSIIIVSTSADASSLFDNISPGADSAVSGLVTLLVAAEALYKYKDDFDDPSKKNVLFIVYEGESWDYIGSSRMVYDMINDKFPYKFIDDQADQMSRLNLSHIDSIIELRQLGLMRKASTKSRPNLFIHSDPISNLDEEVLNKTNLLSDLMISQSSNWKINLKKAKTNATLPPASFQSFLKEKNIPGIVLADHDASYQNTYSQSIFDNYKNLNYKSNANGTDNTDQLHKDLTYTASLLASTLYKYLTGNQKNINASFEITNKLLYCYLQNTNCTFFREYSDESLLVFLNPKPAKMYVSVKRGENHLSYLTGRILSHFMGQKVNNTEEECKSNSTQIMNFDYFPYLDNGTCIQSTLHHSSALSPAFVIENYDWKFGGYSTWTESTWLKTEVRIFLRPSPREEIGLLIGGFLSVFISIAVVYFSNSRASLIFISEVPPASC